MTSLGAHFLVIYGILCSFSVSLIDLSAGVILFHWVSPSCKLAGGGSFKPFLFTIIICVYIHLSCMIYLFILSEVFDGVSDVCKVWVCV